MVCHLKIGPMVQKLDIFFKNLNLFDKKVNFNFEVAQI